MLLPTRGLVSDTSEEVWRIILGNGLQVDVAVFLAKLVAKSVMFPTFCADILRKQR
jgi:hypothetical protein